ncbi:response regulator [Pigmentiphaga soli]|uniref:histidine kinase n=2 Tax=Pigmentiphaga soli TaxID=1007095 RepID=A0ABP8GUQ7_9BURK
MTGGIFALDMMAPPGYAAWVLYVAPVAVCLLAREPAAPFVAATCGTLLLAAAYALSLPAESAGTIVAAVNRCIGVLMLWALAWMAYSHIRSAAALRRHAWIQQGHVELAKGLRGELGAGEIAAQALQIIVRHLGAGVGAFYSLDQGVLRRIGGWALPEETGPSELRVGHGMLGQAVLEQRTLALTGLPPDYLQVASSLGHAAPSAVVATPLSAGGQVVGAMELGFVGKTSLEDETEVLGVAADIIGSTLRSALYRGRLEELLGETQRQSEALQVQQEELRVSNEELEERSRALMDTQARLETQQAELEQTNARLEEHTQDLERQKRGLLTAQRRLAESAAALERASQYKSEFLANMSHELRTPLNSSLILAKLLADNREGTLTPEQVRYARTIHSSNTDLLLLINDILDLSKVEAGQVTIVPEPIELSTVLASMRQSFAPVAEQKGLDLRIETAAGAPQTLVTDGQRLQQILRNLLSNAFKFTERGQVALRAAAAAPGRVRFDVVDSGIGIEASQLEVIFEAFRQADGTTSRKYGGSGLGLSISRQLAHLLGGDITVASEPGAGSTFSLEIAERLEPAESARADDEPAAPADLATARASASLWPGHAGSAGAGTAGEAAPAFASPAPAYEAPASSGVSSEVPIPPSTLRRPAAGIDDDRDHRTRGVRLILVVEDDETFAGILYDLAHELDFDCIHAATAADGLALAHDYQPYGILLDVELPDDSGLTVLDRLKRDPATRHIPVHVVSVADHTEAALFMGAIGYTLKPTARDQLAEAIRSLEARLKQRVRRILVIEDDPALRENISLLLQAPGVELEGAGTVADALRHLAANEFDCVVLDLVLPDGTGYQLLEKMAGDDQHTFPPVIVYTGRSLTPEEEQRLRRYSKSIIIKGARSPERLLDEVTLFLHSVESELPADKQRMLKEARQRDAAFEGRRILLAEDDVRNIFALSQVIEPLGAQLEIARNGLEALNVLAHDTPIDLVLMDIMMPEMDGLTAIREIRRKEQFAHLPIIALTAKAMPTDRQRCLDAGANDYISKPLDIDRLLSLCRVWLPQ